jgi:trans-AT polyketide synthase/acyltransferase/oxidoreductase domain-containing protein
VSELRNHGPRSERPADGWQGHTDTIAYDEPGMRAHLLNLAQPCYAVRTAEGIGLISGELPAPSAHSNKCSIVARAAPLMPEQFGDPRFRQTYGVKAAYACGAMANGIADERLVIAMGQAGLLSSFGAAGLLPARIEQAIVALKQALPNGPYAFNLIHNPHNPALEQHTIELYKQHEIRVVEASAFLQLTLPLVEYRVAGLSLDAQGRIQIGNRVIAKVSHEHIAQQFLQPPPPAMLGQLVRAGRISPMQATLAQYVPMADDLTVEADSGGHTDNQPLICVLPNMIALRDRLQARFRYSEPVRIGAAGGIGTPHAALAAFTLGADYVVTGSINQASLEANTSAYVKQLLAQAGMSDTIMAPSADMFEEGVRVQLLKKGTLYPMQAQKLFELYRRYESIEALPSAELSRLEQQILKRDIASTWNSVVEYFSLRNPQQLQRAQDNPRHRMALIFRWYLGQSSQWAIHAEPNRELDYQIWCGPAMGAFNEWVRGSYLEDPNERRVAVMAREILHGAAYLARFQQLLLQGAPLPSTLGQYRPQSR